MRFNITPTQFIKYTCLSYGARLKKPKDLHLKKQLTLYDVTRSRVSIPRTKDVYLHVLYVE